MGWDLKLGSPKKTRVSSLEDLKLDPGPVSDSLFPIPPDVMARSGLLLSENWTTCPGIHCVLPLPWVRGMLGFVVFGGTGFLCLGLCWSARGALGGGGRGFSTLEGLPRWWPTLLTVVISIC